MFSQYRHGFDSCWRPKRFFVWKISAACHPTWSSNRNDHNHRNEHHIRHISSSTTSTAIVVPYGTDVADWIANNQCRICSTWSSAPELTFRCVSVVFPGFIGLPAAMFSSLWLVPKVIPHDLDPKYLNVWRVKFKDPPQVKIFFCFKPVKDAVWAMS